MSTKKSKSVQPFWRMPSVEEFLQTGALLGLLMWGYAFYQTTNWDSNPLTNLAMILIFANASFWMLRKSSFQLALLFAMVISNFLGFAMVLIEFFD